MGQAQRQLAVEGVAYAVATARVLLVHLRLPFQLLLAPVFLWGWLLAGGGASARVALAFVCLHVFLYGGVTAFNSAYDRDEGPVGGLEHPPPVVPALLPFAVAVKVAGAALAWLVNPPFFLAYAGFALLSVAYSRPPPRLKAHPLGSLVVVGLGQGVLAFLAAWAAVRGEVASAVSPPGPLGMASATLLVLGLYPLTQVFQVAEDRARGDRTVAVAWGPAGAFRLALACQALGGLLLLVVVGQRYGALDALVVGGGLFAQLAAVAAWARRFDPSDVTGGYRHAMRLNTLAAAGLGAYLALRLALG